MDSSFEEEYLEDVKMFELIGNGAFGKVYKGQYKGQDAAIKILQKKQQQYLEQYRKEIEIMEQLNHKNIVRFYSSKETNDNLFIICEYIDGRTLTQVMKQENLETEQIRNLFKQLLQALHYLHSLDIIHRDIKPDNIMVLEDWSIKLIDFGLSHQSEYRKSYDKCGTLLFMAPEMIQKQAYQYSVDIWSCGILQYMLHNEGKHPFFQVNDTVNSFLDRTLRYQPNLQNMDKFASHFFEKCANLQQTGRMTAEQALSHPWITGSGQLKPITFSDMQMMFHTKMKILRLVQGLMFLKGMLKDEDKFYQIKTLMIPLPSEGGDDDAINNDTTSESNKELRLFKVNRSTSRKPSIIKQARSTSTLFFENNVASPFKPASPFRMTQQRVSPNKSLTHSRSMNFSNLTKRLSQIQKLPPISSNSNSPINHQKRQSRQKLNIHFKVIKQ